MPEGQMPKEEREPTYSDVVAGDFDHTTWEWKGEKQGVREKKGTEVVLLSATDEILRAQINTEVDELNRPRFKTAAEVDAELARRKAVAARAVQATEPKPEEEKPPPRCVA